MPYKASASCLTPVTPPALNHRPQVSFPGVSLLALGLRWALRLWGIWTFFLLALSSKGTPYAIHCQDIRKASFLLIPKLYLYLQVPTVYGIFLQINCKITTKQQVIGVARKPLTMGSSFKLSERKCKQTPNFQPPKVSAFRFYQKLVDQFCLESAAPLTENVAAHFGVNVLPLQGHLHIIHQGQVTGVTKNMQVPLT